MERVAEGPTPQATAIARRVVLGLCTIAVLASCSGDSTTVPGPTGTIAAVSGNNQVAVFSTAVTVPPSVRVTGADGQPAAGVVVTFTAAGVGTPHLTDSIQTTGADGIATVGSWHLGSIGSQSLTASAPNVSGTVTFVANAVNVQTAASVAGSNQTAIAGHAVGVAPSVRVSDPFSDVPTQGVTVTFSVAQGGGTVTSATAVTDASGVATVGSWTLGPTAGTNKLTASVGLVGVLAVNFLATGTSSIRQ